MKATRVEMLGDDGEWHEVPGIASVEIHPAEPADAPRIPLRTRLVHEAWWWISRWPDEQRALGREAIAHHYTVRQQRRGPDRPAWQSPYGPPQRRN